MPRPTMEQVRGLGDVATIYQWNVTFVNFPAALNGGVIPTTEDLNLRMTSTTLPVKGNMDQDINIRGHVTSQSGQAEYNKEINFGFYETVDNVISNFFLAWEETCTQTGTGAHGSKTDSECAIEIERLNRQDVPIWLYFLVGCRLKTYTLTDLTGENDTFKPGLTIKYDYFKQQAI